MSITDSSHPWAARILHMDSFSLLFQRVNLEDLFAFNCQFPIGIQFFAANFDPCLNKTSLVFGKFSCKQFSVRNAENSLLVPVFHMDMGHMMLFIVCVNTSGR